MDPCSSTIFYLGTHTRELMLELGGEHRLTSYEYRWPLRWLHVHVNEVRSKLAALDWFDILATSVAWQHGLFRSTHLYMADYSKQNNASKM
jgi:hypothetical protein